jgi:hypothetical protein
MHLNFYNIIQFLSLFVAIFCYKGLKKFSLFFFIPLLVFTCVIEILATNNALFGWKSNYFIYNTYLLISLPLYLIIYGKMIDLYTKARVMYILICILCESLIILNYLFLEGWHVFNSYSLIFTEILQIIFCCLLLIQLALKEDKYNVYILKHPYFWINASTLLFSLGTFVLLGLQKYIALHHIEIDGKSMYRIFLPILNVILYSSYTYAFFLCKTQPNKTL